MSRHNQLTITCEIGKKYEAMKKSHSIYNKKYNGKTDLNPTGFAKEFVDRFRKGDIIKSWNGGTTASLSLMVNHGNIRMVMEDLQPFFRMLESEKEDGIGFVRSNVYGFFRGEEHEDRRTYVLLTNNDFELKEDVLYRRVHELNEDAMKSNEELASGGEPHGYYD